MMFAAASSRPPAIVWILQRRMLRNGEFDSVDDLAGRIVAFR